MKFNKWILAVSALAALAIGTLKAPAQSVSFIPPFSILSTNGGFVQATNSNTEGFGWVANASTTNTTGTISTTRSQNFGLRIAATGMNTNAIDTLVLQAYKASTANPDTNTVWFRDNARDVTLTFNGTATINHITNFTLLGPYPSYRYTVALPVTTGAVAQTASNLVLHAFEKSGL